MDEEHLPLFLRKPPPAPPAPPTPEPSTLLHEAAAAGDVPLIRRLIEQGHPVNLPGDYGNTPLFHAVEHPDAVRVLLEHGAEVCLIDSSGESILMGAVKAGNSTSVELLILNGAEVNQHEGQLSETPIQWAVGEGFIDVVAVLVNHGADPFMNDFRQLDALDALAGWAKHDFPKAEEMAKILRQHPRTWMLPMIEKRLNALGL
jgi:ankyrin repeat protein